MNKKIDSIILREKNTIRDAMERMNKSGAHIVCVTDDNKKLLGVITDGDIRRALTSGRDLGVLLKEIMILNPITAAKTASVESLLKIMIQRGIQGIPIIDDKRILLDVVLLKDLKTIPLSSPDITHKEAELISEVLNTPFLSIGPKVKEFEKKIANYIGTKYAVAVNSGTSGLHLCIRSLDIKDGDEVITTPFSFIASANCILFERAKPVFVDIDENTLCIDTDKIEEKITKKTKAILPVHVFGYPCEMDKITGIAKKYNLAVIEDACEAIGSEYNNRKVGGCGDVGVFAFYPNKQITTAEGGMIVTNNEKIANLCRSMRNQGRDEEEKWLCHKMLGYNYRMSELNAALGVVQMERIEEILSKRQRAADLYNKRLSKIKKIKIPHTAFNVKISWFVYVIRLDDKLFSHKERDNIILELKNRGIACSNYFPPIHLQPFYKEQFSFKEGDFPITENISALTIALPFYNNLTEEQINYICDSLEEIIS